MGRETGTNTAGEVCASRKSTTIKGMKREKTRSRAERKTDKGFDSRGGAGAVEKIRDGAFMEVKPSCSLVEKSNLVTERLTDRLDRGAIDASATTVESRVWLHMRESATERRFIDQQSNYGTAERWSH